MVSRLELRVGSSLQMRLCVKSISFAGLTSVIFLTILPLCQDECDQMVCLNEGQCHYNKDKQKYQCKCILPWFGDACEKKIGKQHCYKSQCIATRTFILYNNMRICMVSMYQIAPSALCFVKN